jgi:hypothetical protein
MTSTSQFMYDAADIDQIWCRGITRANEPNELKQATK